jgi:hypothetical protein
MLRSLFCSLFALVVLAGGVMAAEIKGTLKSVDSDKGIVTVTVDGKDTEYKVGEGAKVLNPAGKEAKNGLKNPNLKAGTEVTLTTDKKGGKEVVTEIKWAAKKKNNK